MPSQIRLALVLGAAVAAVIASADASEPDGYRARVENPTECSDAEAADKWGICAYGVRLSAAGYLLDYRFHVLDANKAAPLLDRKHTPRLMVERVGAVPAVSASSVGALRQSSRSTDDEPTYLVFFANPGRRIASGDVVTVSIGEFTAKHLQVE